MKKILLVIPIFLIFFHLMYASDGPQIWTQDVTTSSGVFNDCIQIDPTNAQNMYAGTNGAGVYKSTNGGANWTQVNSNLNTGVQALGISASNPLVLYAGTATAGMYKTTDGGTTWTQMNAGITQTPNSVQAITVSRLDPNFVIISVWDGSNSVNAVDGVYKTTNGGTLWTVANVGMTTKNILSLCMNRLRPNTVYAGSSFLVPNPPGTGPTFVYKSYDGGNTWTNSSTGLPTDVTELNPVRCLSMSTIDTNTILAGLFWNTTNGGPYFSTNGGSSWTHISGGFPISTVPGPLLRSCLIRPGTNTEFYIGGDYTNVLQPGGVWQSTDAGTTWADFNGGTMQNIFAVRGMGFRVSDNTLFAGVTVGSMGVHEYTLLPLAVNNQNTEIPKNFSLNQNYPNPFNPSTIIEYAVPKTAFVTVKVYDLMGKEVKTLVSETKQAGYYSLTFNASNLTSGVYFYKIIAGDFTASKKMMLIK
jgi:photosystem II stability/assembly factor-like uncharacterized protein